jgi:hypothetical protein
MIQVGIWTGQKWVAKAGVGAPVQVQSFRFETGQVVAEAIACRHDRPVTVLDLSEFVRTYRLVSNG